MEKFKKSSKTDLKGIHTKVLRVAMMLSLILLIFTFYSFQTFNTTVTLPEDVDFTTKTILIPQTKQLQRPPRPVKPSFPVEAEEDEIPDAVKIDEAVFSMDDVADAAPPEMDIEEVYEFHKVQKKPVLINHAIPAYPELAKKAGIQGKVVVTVTIDTKGNVENAVILKSIPMLDDAALAAAKRCKFKPAMQHDRFVKVRMNIPFTFRLR